MMKNRGSGVFQPQSGSEPGSEMKKDIFLDSATTIQGYVIDENKEQVKAAKVEFFNEKDEVVTTDEQANEQIMAWNKRVPHLLWRRARISY